MIASLSGKITQVSEKTVVLTVHGVGYLVVIAPHSVSALQVGQQAELFVHTAVSENDIRLFGFQSAAELELFKKLITVKGVGPKVALGIFGLPLAVIETAIAAEDHKTLASVPGLGPKTAQQICLDLRGKIDLASVVSAPPPTKNGQIPTQNPHLGDACEALCHLGCDRGEVMRALVSAPTKLTSEELVRWFLGKK